jgi:hypothetical protein
MHEGENVGPKGAKMKSRKLDSAITSLVFKEKNPKLSFARQQANYLSERER